MSQKQENYNNHDIRIGAFASVTLDLKVNCNYVISCIKKVNNPEEDFYEKKLGKMISYGMVGEEAEYYLFREVIVYCCEDLV